jgi:hypothetical protein
MRKILTTIVLAASALTAQADPYHHHGHRGGYYAGGNWVAPLVIGGIAGYALSRPQPVVVQQPPVILQQPTPMPVYGQPVYQYQSIWFDDCSCYKSVLVKIQ